MIEYPTGLQFLNQHGDISIFSDGFTAMERKYLKFLLLRMSVQADNIADIIVKSISKKDLHKVSIYFLILLNFSPEILNMIIIKPCSNSISSTITDLVYESTDNSVVCKISGPGEIYTR